MTIGIGSTVWVFDSNHRVYPRDSSGRALPGGPIFREHFRPRVIESETIRSWVLDGGLKVPKQGGDVRDAGGGPYGKSQVFMTAEAVDAAVWHRVHAHRVAEKVGQCKDVALLRQIAAMIGYVAESEGER